MKKRKAKTPRIPRLWPALRSSVPAFFLIVFSSQLFSTPAPGYIFQKRLKANEPYALIVGTVWGPDDRPVYGVTVKIRRSRDKKAKWEMFSDHHGEFAQRVPAGQEDYVVWADLKGFKPADGKALHLVQEAPVHIENEERVDIGLHLGR